MTVVRSVTLDDIDKLWDLIGQATYGLTTLQITKDQLTERVELAQFAFQRKTKGEAGWRALRLCDGRYDGGPVGRHLLYLLEGWWVRAFLRLKMVDRTIHCKRPGCDATRHVTSLHLQKIHDGPRRSAVCFCVRSIEARVGGGY